ncbi:MAG: hypothetical protein ACNS62_11815 [Candidatus Cyclobacteriaceae bacterium M3_2C_046]
MVKNIIYTVGILLIFILIIRLGISFLLTDDDNLGKEKVFSDQHPRLLLQTDQVADVRQRLGRKPYNLFYEDLSRITRDIEIMTKSAGDTADIYDLSYLASHQAALYLLSGEKIWSGKAEQNLDQVFESEYWQNPLSRGLTRSTLLQRAALTYDLCYNSWSENKNTFINQELYRVLFNTNANMGYSANYSIASNWMGVRYGSVLLAARAYDHPTEADQRSPVLPVMWDATNKFRQHLAANIYRNGWNSESLGYHNYNWMFIGPALIALNEDVRHDEFSLENFAPQAIHSLKALSISTVAIETRNNLGMKPDFSDDHLNSNILSGLATGFELYPEAQKPALKWMFDYLYQPGLLQEDRGSLFYAILNYPEQLTPQNPASLGWLNYHDPDQGIVILRNRFEDENDIVASYSATATRVKGHRGPDTNTFRIIGMGVPWVVGAGRTNQVEGQTNLFPAIAETPEKGDLDQLGRLINFRFEGQSVFGIGTGNVMNVKGHKRFFYASYVPQSGAEAAFLIADQSVNGRRWRINTPEFNQVLIQDDGFILVGPNGSSLKFVVLDQAIPVRIETGQVRYGGNTSSHNNGILFNGQVYRNNNWIDVYCDKNITVAMTLQGRGEKHPQVKWMDQGVIIGNHPIQIRWE